MKKSMFYKKLKISKAYRNGFIICAMFLLSKVVLAGPRKGEICESDLEISQESLSLKDDVSEVIGGDKDKEEKEKKNKLEMCKELYGFLEEKEPEETVENISTGEESNSNPAAEAPAPLEEDEEKNTEINGEVVGEHQDEPSEEECRKLFKEEDNKKEMDQKIMPEFNDEDYGEPDEKGNRYFLPGRGGSHEDGSRKGGMIPGDAPDGYNFQDYPTSELLKKLDEENKEYNIAAKAVGKFTGGGNNCTAQVVGDGYIMTNNHCLSNPNQIAEDTKITFDYNNDSSTKPFSVSCSHLVTSNAELDMALIKCENIPKERGKIKLSEKNPREFAGKKMHSFTHESGKRTQYTNGEIKAGGNGGVVTTTVSAREGSSGSVGLVEEGEGDKKQVTALTLRNKRGPLGRRISFEIPMADIVKFMECSGNKVPNDAFSSIMDRPKNLSSCRK